MDALPAHRQREIVDRLEHDGFVKVTTLAAEMGVDQSTIRRDLAQLARASLVQRARGGALRIAPEPAEDIPYDLKRAVQTEAKSAIGRAAADLVVDGQTILLDSGSTTYQMVPWLRHRRSLTVITNDIHIAHRLAHDPGIRLIVAGGELLERVYTLVGPQTLAMLSELHVDQTFLGADAIDREVGITNTNLVEVAVKRAMIAAAPRTTVLADSTKLERRTLARVAGLDEITALITDDGAPPEVRSLYADVPTTLVHTTTANHPEP
jgi:DeoR/GlpR family transcriptional regulator of sugar metabolism